MTLEKASKNPRNPRNIKDFGGWRFCSSADDQELRRREAIDVAWCDWFESLLEALSDLGAPFSLPSDDVLCVDLDQFIDVPMARRRRWLTKAKRELVQRYLHQCVMDIWEAASEGDEATVTAELGSFLGIGAPPGHADIDATFYGKRLSAAERKQWADLARLAARAEDDDDAVARRPCDLRRQHVDKKHRQDRLYHQPAHATAFAAHSVPA